MGPNKIDLSYLRSFAATWYRHQLIEQILKFQLTTTLLCSLSCESCSPEKIPPREKEKSLKRAEKKKREKIYVVFRPSRFPFSLRFPLSLSHPLSLLLYFLWPRGCGGGEGGCSRPISPSTTSFLRAQSEEGVQKQWVLYAVTSVLSSYAPRVTSHPYLMRQRVSSGQASTWFISPGTSDSPWPCHIQTSDYSTNWIYLSIVCVSFRI